MTARDALTVSRRPFLALAAVFLLALVPADASGAGVLDVRGEWAGFFQSSVHAEDRGMVEIFVTSQKKRRFHGDLVGNWQGGMEPILVELPIDGTISAGEVLNLQGKKGAEHFRYHARVQEFGGTLISIGQYRFRMADGTFDEGTLILQLAFGGLDARELQSPSLLGEWTGEFVSRTSGGTGPAGFSFDVQEGGVADGVSAFDGNLFAHWNSVKPDGRLVGIAMNAADGSVMLYRGQLVAGGVRLVADYQVLMPSSNGLIELDVGTFSVGRVLGQ